MSLNFRNAIPALAAAIAGCSTVSANTRPYEYPGVSREVRDRLIDVLERAQKEPMPSCASLQMEIENMLMDNAQNFKEDRETGAIRITGKGFIGSVNVDQFSSKWSSAVLSVETKLDGVDPATGEKTPLIDARRDCLKVQPKKPVPVRKPAVYR
ncbi:hypothetical protein COV82_00465 [Candidatus Peregrinibacteria bacterium CG11_big_fil_rev_8_21_14_0_20_46_8]|nr:MAG: hypothetical protein COV82_00465 [Candidatus Peregrinibacteria bacterium CG11_big_fil_rev_8_21_14_0_20_46_8]